MKPTKKKDLNSNKNQTQFNTDNSTSKIKAYFNSAPKSFVVEDQPKKDDPQSSSKQFYIDILKAKLKSIDEATAAEGADMSELDGACALFEKPDVRADNVTEKGDMNHPDDNGSKIECPGCVQKAKESKEWEEKYKELKRMYFKLTMHHSELDLKHSDLKKVLTGKSHASNSDDAVHETTTSNDIFTANELKFLQCMSLEKSKDSTFVHHCLQYAYKSNPSVLVFKSLKGTSDSIEITEAGDKIHHPAKEPISPHKVNRIKEVFLERISKCTINSVSYGERVKDSYINKLFAGGIKNIAKKQH